MLNVELHFSKLTIEKVDSFAQVVVNLLRAFPRMESFLDFSIKDQRTNVFSFASHIAFVASVESTKQSQ